MKESVSSMGDQYKFTVADLERCGDHRVIETFLLVFMASMRRGAQTVQQINLNVTPHHKCGGGTVR